MSIDKVFSGLFGGGAADDALDMQEMAIAQQGKLIDKQVEGMDWLIEKGRELWDFQVDNYRPVERQALATAGEGLAPDFEGIRDLGGQAAQRVASQYQTGREANRRELERRGVDPGSGSYKALELSSRLGEAADRAGAFTRGQIEEDEARRTERKYAEEQTFNRRADMARAGRGLDGTREVSAAASGLGSAASQRGNQATTYGNIAGAHAGQAADTAEAVLSLATMAAGGFG